MATRLNLKKYIATDASWRFVPVRKGSAERWAGKYRDKSLACPMQQQGYDGILNSDHKGGEQVVLSSAGNRP
jgi:hypothetical protein